MALPSKVALKAPAIGSTVSKAQVSLVWTKSAPHISKYRLQLALDDRFTDLLINDSTLADSSAIARDLQDGDNCWWRIQARNAEGWGEWSQGYFIVALSSALRKPNPDAAPRVSAGDGIIRYRLPSGVPVSIRAWDAQGKVFLSLTHVYQPAGAYELPIPSGPRNSPLMLEFAAGNHVEMMELRRARK